MTKTITFTQKEVEEALKAKYPELTQGSWGFSGKTYESNRDSSFSVTATNYGSFFK
jgi:hypothetical protein